MTDEEIKNAIEINARISMGIHMLTEITDGAMGIYNCTRGGSLEEFPRIKLEEALTYK